MISADGKRILSSCSTAPHGCGISPAATRSSCSTAVSGPVYAVGFAPDGSILTADRDHSIKAWPAAGGEAVALFPGAPDQN